MRPVWWFDMKRYKRIKEPGILTGLKRICAYMQIGPAMFYKLYEHHGLPAMRLPGKAARWCTSRHLIDEWVVARWKAQKAAAYAEDQAV